MNSINITRNRLSLLLILVFALFSITGCAKKIQFQRSSVVPAAEGKVKLKKDGNDNYKIDVNVDRLANSKDLTPSKDAYVLWIETEEHGTQNLGQFKTSSGLLSSALKGSLSTVTPYKPRRIFITAENDASTTYPGGEIVLTTGTFSY